MIARGFRFKLEPTAEQEALFRQFAGVCRLVYNLGLEQRATWGRKHRIGYVQQAADLTRLRAEFDWIGAVPARRVRLDRRGLCLLSAAGLARPRQGVHQLLR